MYKTADIRVYLRSITWFWGGVVCFCSCQCNEPVPLITNDYSGDRDLSVSAQEAKGPLQKAPCQPCWSSMPGAEDVALLGPYNPRHFLCHPDSAQVLQELTLLCSEDHGVVEI